MVRGLSREQKGILFWAFNLREADRSIWFREIMIHLYHWKSAPDRGPLSEEGQRKYRSILAAVSRSITRLERRGLVTRIRGGPGGQVGVRLTDEGVRRASRIQRRKGTPGNG